MNRDNVLEDILFQLREWRRNADMLIEVNWVEYKQLLILAHYVTYQN